MNITRYVIWLGVVLVFLVAACSGLDLAPDASDGAGDGTMVETVGGDGSWDVLFPDQTNQSDVPHDGEISSFDVTEDDTESEILDADEDLLEPGAAGWMCEDENDCLEPFCIETGDGKKCSQSCIEECPFDWLCVEYPPALPDLIYICVPPATSLCRPCTKNDDCLVHGLDFDERCVDYGPDGAYCASGCELDSCPNGYNCEDVEDVNGVKWQGCVPEDGQCDCTSDDVNAGAWTECYQANTAGICWGTRECTGGGLTDCDAQVPLPEACNGFDDNCNGELDENIVPEACLVKNEFGKCFGEKVCTNGAWQCDANDPEPELCDGKDNDCDGLVDESFQDTNGDGLADCLTDDADGDGIANSSDNCPFISNQDQDDHDLDTIGDACDPDDDNDQFADDQDCEPFNQKVNPGEDEACDGFDNDCDSKVDEGFTNSDGDEEADCVDDDDDDDGVDDEADCEPLNPVVAPGLPELCNGTDENCDGVVDEGYPDFDGDGEADCIDSDFDGDSVEDAVDNCPFDDNPDQEDLDDDGLGDVCDKDDDNDFVNDDPDNCPHNFNPFQEDLDLDGQGNVCDSDDDGDAKPDGEDNCPLDANVEQLDLDNDGLGNVCDPDLDGDGDHNGMDCAPADGAIHSNAEEVCDGVDNDCDIMVDEGFTDTDGDDTADCVDEDDDDDGVDDGEDCEPLNPVVAPGLPELCNGTDENCDGMVDEGYPDFDGDGEADCIDSDFDGDTVEDAVDNCPFDGNPDQEDLDDDGLGDVCDSDDDNDFVKDEPDNCPHDFNPFQEDLDQDGQGNTCDWDDDGDGKPDGEDNCPLDANIEQLDLDNDGIGNACDPDLDGDGELNGMDCAPANAEIHSNAVEICDAADNDCNGQVDEAGAEGCAEWYLDGDQDGFGANQAAICLCAPDYLYTASTAGDCEDGNPAIHPDAEEVCNGLDDDCDGSGDPVDAPGCKIWYVDADADGYGDSDKGQCMCGAMTPYVVLVGADCEDLNVAVNPGQAEVCNGIDDNCDGDIDPPLVPGCINYFQDKDEDGWGVAEITKCLCEPKLPHTALQAGDCSDLDSEVNPAADEVCNDKDDDCDGKIDPAGTDGCVPHFKDGDQDGFGWLPVTKCLCLATQDFPVTNFGDCNDVDSGINPDQAELCNDVDDDCDYKVDEDFADKGKLCDGLDLDTCKNGTFTCREDGEGLECTNEDVVKAELCNGFDDDCDGSIDEDFPDTDDDGQADCMDNDDDGDTIHDILDNCPLHANEDQLDTDGDETGDACDEDDDEDGTVDDDDCEPLNPDVHPQAVEVCNGVDDNCSGETDEDFPDKSVPCDGDDTDLCKTGTWTCKADGSGLECINEVVKNVTEICDGEDNDCDGEFDENFPLKGTDCDGTDSDLCTNGTWTCKQAGDDVECVNEAIVDIPESCNNDDDDCDGETDEENADGCQTFHLDVDDDTYGTDATKCLCQATGDYTAGQPGDCSDGNGAVHPGAQEVCNNNIDDNCNGSTDEGCVTCKYMGTKYGNGDWSCPSGWRMPKQTEWTLVQPCVAGKESSYYHGTAYQVGGCNCKWNGSWCGQKSIDTFDQGRLCGDYWGHHVCVPN